MLARFALASLLVVVALGSASGCSSEDPVQLPDPDAACSTDPADLPVLPIDARTLNGCLGQANGEQCLELLFRAYLRDHTTHEALAALQAAEDSDAAIRLGCHPIAHAVGRETFRKTGTVYESFDMCDQTCHSGCYHGVMERFLRGSPTDCSGTGEHILFEELQARAADACDPSLDATVRFQCLHGLGHALMYFSGYDLRESLLLCDATGDSWSRSSCYGGVFMENIVAVMPELRDLKRDDLHYPCDELDAQYVPDCYSMQTSWMSEVGLSPAQIFEECRNAGDYRLNCIQSLGRDLSNGARIGDPHDVAQTCELGMQDEVEACTRGVVYALVDNTWDGRYAIPYCAEYEAAAAVSYCYAVALGYLSWTFGMTHDQIVAECQQYAPGSDDCLASVP